MSDDPKLPSEEDNASSISNYYKTSEASKTDKSISEHKKQPKKWWKNIDQALLSTVALTVISLCALFVSIYQTRVLSSQQEVMAEQQRIMTESAKAQLWPNVEISYTNSTAGNNGGVVVRAMRFAIANTGTGPAIIENVSVRFKETYIRAWWELFELDDVSDTIPEAIETQDAIANRVIQAGERYTFLSYDNNPAMMSYLFREISEGNGFTITVCYKSVFDEHWQLVNRVGLPNQLRAASVDKCNIPDSIAFLN